MAELTRTKTFIPLESNPAVMTTLAHKLGMDPSLAFHDLYSLYERDLIDMIPTPPLALLFIYPETPVSTIHQTNLRAAPQTEYNPSDPAAEPIVFFPQIINHACGLIGLLHCITNNPKHVTKNSNLDNLLITALPLSPAARAQLLSDSDDLEAAHAIAAQQGDSVAPELGVDPNHAFTAYVKGKDGCLWELPGPDYKTPVNRGKLGDNDDVLAEKALDLGPRAFVKREMEGAQGGSVEFGCLVLAAKVEA